MGQSRNKLQRFLDANQTCIFCGGNQQANTQDHIPPRSFFIDRKWPEGYVFPACQKCNNQSSDAEYVTSIFAKMGWGLLPGHNINPQIYDELLLELKYKKPAIFHAMQNKIPAATKKRIIREAGLNTKPGTTIAEIPLVRIPLDVDKYMEQFGLKLCKALHFKHTGVIVPDHFRYKFRWFTNFQVIQQEFQKVVEIFQSFESAKQLKRDNLDLSKQFSYDYAITENSNSSAFYCKFSDMFSVLMWLTFDQEYIADIDRLEQTKHDEEA